MRAIALHHIVDLSRRFSWMPTIRPFNCGFHNSLCHSTTLPLYSLTFRLFDSATLRLCDSATLRLCDSATLVHARRAVALRMPMRDTAAVSRGPLKTSRAAR